MNMTIGITKWLGGAIFLIGVARIFNFGFSSLFLIGCSLGALFFVIADFLHFYYRKSKKEILKIVKGWPIAPAVFSIVFLPQITSLQSQDLTQWSDAAALIGLGLTVLLIGLKTERNTAISFRKLHHTRLKERALYRKIIDRQKKLHAELNRNLDDNK